MATPLYIPNATKLLRQPRVQVPDSGMSNAVGAGLAGALRSLTGIAETYRDRQNFQAQAKSLADALEQEGMTTEANLYRAAANNASVNFFADAQTNRVANRALLSDSLNFIKLKQENDLRIKLEELNNANALGRLQTEYLLRGKLSKEEAERRRIASQSILDATTNDQEPPFQPFSEATKGTPGTDLLMPELPEKSIESEPGFVGPPSPKIEGIDDSLLPQLNQPAPRITLPPDSDPDPSVVSAAIRARSPAGRIDSEIEREKAITARMNAQTRAETLKLSQEKYREAKAKSAQAEALIAEAERQGKLVRKYSYRDGTIAGFTFADPATKRITRTEGHALIWDENLGMEKPIPITTIRTTEDVPTGQQTIQDIPPVTIPPIEATAEKIREAIKAGSTSPFGR